MELLRANVRESTSCSSISTPRVGRSLRWNESAGMRNILEVATRNGQGVTVETDAMLLSDVSTAPVLKRRTAPDCYMVFRRCGHSGWGAIMGNPVVSGIAEHDCDRVGRYPVARGALGPVASSNAARMMIRVPTASVRSSMSKSGACRNGAVNPGGAQPRRSIAPGTRDR